MCISPYLTYAGDCGQAIDLYVAAFNADVQSLVTFSETDMIVPPGMDERVASAVLVVGDTSLHLADTLRHDPMRPEPQVSLLLECDLNMFRQAQRVLLEGGSWLPTMIRDANRASCRVVDRFGVTWQLVETAASN